VATDSTLGWTDLSNITPGRVHLLGNWQMPTLREFQFDLFWNAASFGEMEPDVVENYLSNRHGWRQVDISSAGSPWEGDRWEKPCAEEDRLP